MDHQRAYFKLMAKAQARVQQPGEAYERHQEVTSAAGTVDSGQRHNGSSIRYERHHVLPRSMGGTDDPSNLVLLTPREHYIAHLLLAHMPGFEQQWSSVELFLKDTLNPRRPLRFLHPRIRWHKWIRRRIAYQAAYNMRNKAKLSALASHANQIVALTRSYEMKVKAIEEQYAESLLEIAFDEF